MEVKIKLLISLIFKINKIKKSIKLFNWTMAYHIGVLKICCTV
jgi:hypothetical protein